MICSIYVLSTAIYLLLPELRASCKNSTKIVQCSTYGCFIPIMHICPDLYRRFSVLFYTLDSSDDDGGGG